MAPRITDALDSTRQLDVSDVEDGRHLLHPSLLRSGRKERRVTRQRQGAGRGELLARPRRRRRSGQDRCRDGAARGSVPAGPEPRADRPARCALRADREHRRYRGARARSGGNWPGIAALGIPGVGPSPCGSGSEVCDADRPVVVRSVRVVAVRTDAQIRTGQRVSGTGQAVGRRGVRAGRSGRDSRTREFRSALQHPRCRRRRTVLEAGRRWDPGTGTQAVRNCARTARGRYRAS